MAEGMRRSLSALAMLIFFLAIAVVLFASVLHLCEKQIEVGVDGAEVLDVNGHQVVLANGYESIFHAMWPTIVTMTTVGYGDVVPASFEKKCKFWTSHKIDIKLRFEHYFFAIFLVQILYD